MARSLDIGIYLVVETTLELCALACQLLRIE